MTLPKLPLCHDCTPAGLTLAADGYGGSNFGACERAWLHPCGGALPPSVEEIVGDAIQAADRPLVRCRVCDKLPDPIPGCADCDKRSAAQRADHAFWLGWWLPLVLLLALPLLGCPATGGHLTPVPGSWQNGHYTPGGWYHTDAAGGRYFVPSARGNGKR